MTDAETQMLFALHRAARAEFDFITDPTPEHERAWRAAEAEVLALRSAEQQPNSAQPIRTQEAA